MPLPEGTKHETLVSAAIVVGFLVAGLGWLLDVRWLQALGLLPVGLFIIIVVFAIAAVLVLSVCHAIAKWRRPSQ